MKRKIVLLLAVATMSIGMLAGCGEKETAKESSTEVEVSESAETSLSEEPDTQTAPEYTFTDMSETMYIQDSVSVLTLPTRGGEERGKLFTNQEVKVTGQCDETSWYRIEYNGSAGYIPFSDVGYDKLTASDYTYTDMSVIMYPNCRTCPKDLPTEGRPPELGELAVNQEVHVTGQCNETGWYRIEYEGGVAYVDYMDLDDKKNPYVDFYND